jgi:hypothetical protein
MNHRTTRSPDLADAAIRTLDDIPAVAGVDDIGPPGTSAVLTELAAARIVIDPGVATTISLATGRDALTGALARGSSTVSLAATRTALAHTLATTISLAATRRVHGWGATAIPLATGWRTGAHALTGIGPVTLAAANTLACRLAGVLTRDLSLALRRRLAGIRTRDLSLALWLVGTSGLRAGARWRGLGSCWRR